MWAPRFVSRRGMRLITISDDFYDELGDDPEMLTKRNRPCILMLNLIFRGKRRRFAVPLRSNIAPNAPKNQYFPLPPRPTTKPKHRHGIHYIKMFPIAKRHQQRFRTEGNPYYENLEHVIEQNIGVIVGECQAYLDRYEREGKPRYAVDIDRAIRTIENTNARGRD